MRSVIGWFKGKWLCKHSNKNIERKLSQRDFIHFELFVALLRDFMSFIHRLSSSPSAWYFSLIPINMALGSVKIVITLAALSLGASLFDIGVMIAANATVSIVGSIGWGRVSDYLGVRVRFLVLFFLVSAPLFVLLGTANAVWQLIVLFTVLAVSTAGIQPIAAMYAVEYREGKNWQREIVKYNSYWNVGVIVGLVVNSLIAWLFR